MGRINFLGCPVDNVDMQDALNWMDNRIIERNPGSIAVVNANKFWQMSKDARLRQFVQSAELVIPEWAVFWGARRVGTPLKAYVPGVALLQAAMPWAEKKGYRPFFLGAKPNVINALIERLKSEFPKLNPAGFHHGYLITKDENQAVRDEIDQSNPDLVFLAMGSPKQEYWMTENSKMLQIPVSMGVGGGFDVLAGIKEIHRIGRVAMG